MAAIVDAINRQMDQSIFNNPSREAKLKLTSQCELLKKVTIVVAIIAPIFAFFLPAVFGLVACSALGLIAYDLSNMIDNLGDAAKISAEGINLIPKSNIQVLLDGTLTEWFFHQYINGPLTYNNQVVSKS